MKGIHSESNKYPISVTLFVFLYKIFFSFPFCNVVVAIDLLLLCEIPRARAGCCLIGLACTPPLCRTVWGAVRRGDSRRARGRAVVAFAGDCAM